MASSSVSQESLDINDDYELNARRTRIRTLRARGALHRVGDRDSETSGDICDMNGDEETSGNPGRHKLLADIKSLKLVNSGKVSTQPYTNLAQVNRSSITPD
jgi:hypothetical protein